MLEAGTIAGGLERRNLAALCDAFVAGRGKWQPELPAQLFFSATR